MRICWSNSNTYTYSYTCIYFDVSFAKPVTCVFYSAHSQSLLPASTHTQSSEQCATSDTSEFDTSVSKTSPDIDSSEPKSQEKATVSFMYRHYVQTLFTGHFVPSTMYRTLCSDTIKLNLIILANYIIYLFINPTAIYR